MPIRLTPDAARQLGIGTPRKRSKYRAEPTVYNGVRYASKAEATRAENLDFFVSIGAVSWWIGQPVFRLGCAENVYRADFLVISGITRTVRVEDVKGMETSKFKRDKKLWAAHGPCPLWLIRNGRVSEIIRPRRDLDPAAGAREGGRDDG